MKTQYPWIVCKQDGFELYCKRCNSSYKPRLPIAISLFVSLSDQFVKDHKKCKESQ